jgi:hypothetical protein
MLRPEVGSRPHWIIALIAVIGALSPVPYLTSYGTWVAILAYVVLAVGNLAST